MTNNLKRAKVTVTRRPRYTSAGLIPLRIEEKTVRVARATRALIKQIINK